MITGNGPSPSAGEVEAVDHVSLAVVEPPGDTSRAPAGAVGPGVSSTRAPARSITAGGGAARGVLEPDVAIGPDPGAFDLPTGVAEPLQATGGDGRSGRTGPGPFVVGEQQRLGVGPPVGQRDRAFEVEVRGRPVAGGQVPDGWTEVLPSLVADGEAVRLPATGDQAAAARARPSSICSATVSPVRGSMIRSRRVDGVAVLACSSASREPSAESPARSLRPCSMPPMASHSGLRSDLPCRGRRRSRRTGQTRRRR